MAASFRRWRRRLLLPVSIALHFALLAVAPGGAARVAQRLGGRLGAMCCLLLRDGALLAALRRATHLAAHALACGREQPIALRDLLTQGSDELRRRWLV